MKKNKKVKKNIYRKITTLSIWIIAICLLAWIGLFELNKMFGDTKKVTTTESGETIVEVDNTPKKEIVTMLLAGLDEDKTRTDTMIYVRYNTTTNKLYMLSIPRDTYTEYVHATYRLNTIYGYGGEKRPDELVQRIEKILGTNIDYYLVFDLDMIPTIVNSIGTLNITLDRDVSVHYMGEDNARFTLYKGKEYNLNATEVEGLARNRYYPNGDLERGRVQRQVIVALIKNMTTSKNILKIPNMLKTVITNTDTSITIREAMKYSDELKEIDLANIESENMPILNMDYRVNGNSTVIIDEDGAKEIIKKWEDAEKVNLTATSDKETIEN